MASFKIYRRSTLSNEVDGIWHDLEEEEDNFIPQTISSQECQTLRKVLARNDDMGVLPNTCKLVGVSGTKGGYVSSLTRSSDLGKVSLGECKQLSTSLATIVGGTTFLPSSCVAMLKRDDEIHRERQVQLLSRREVRRVPTYVAEHGYPPLPAK